MACRYCYHEGHNRRSCPELTRRLEERAKAGDEYSAAELAKRGKGKSKSNRRCSFCNERGHDRRTCEKIKTVVKNGMIEILKARRLILDNAHKNGFGVGSLVTYTANDFLTDGTYGEREVVALVTDIEWSEITDTTPAGGGNINGFLTVSYHDVEGNQRSRRLPFPSEIVASTETEDEWYANRRPKFVGPVDGPTTVPDDYASNRAVEKLIRDQVKDKRSWQYGL